MSLHRTSPADLEAHLAHLGLEPGCRVVVHSQLATFGLIDGGEAAVYAVLRNFIGDAGTIAVPTYNLLLDPDEPYDAATTPSIGMGVLAEYVRGLPNARRTACPMHNHSAVGPDAATVAGADPLISLGHESDFEAMYEAGFCLLLLGCSFSDGATYLHHIEALKGVPYRKWVSVRRTVRGDDGWRPVDVRYFGFPKDRPRLPLAFDRIVEPMTARGALRSATAPYGTSYCMALSDLHLCAAEHLTADPYYLVERDPNDAM